MVAVVVVKLDLGSLHFTSPVRAPCASECTETLQRCGLTLQSCIPRELNRSGALFVLLCHHRIKGDIGVYFHVREWEKGKTSFFN